MFHDTYEIKNKNSDLKQEDGPHIPKGKLNI